MEQDTHSIGDSTTSSEDTIHQIESLTQRISRLSEPEPSLTRRVTSHGTSGTSDPSYEVDWEGDNDPENPKNWSLAYKAMCIAFLSWNTVIM